MIFDAIKRGTIELIIWDMATDGKIGMWSRVRRTGKGGERGGAGGGMNTAGGLKDD